jgi:hypothetical protein
MAIGLIELLHPSNEVVALDHVCIGRNETEEKNKDPKKYVPHIILPVGAVTSAAKLKKPKTPLYLNITKTQKKRITYRLGTPPDLRRFHLDPFFCLTPLWSGVSMEVEDAVSAATVASQECGPDIHLTITPNGEQLQNSQSMVTKFYIQRFE